MHADGHITNTKRGTPDDEPGTGTTPGHKSEPNVAASQRSSPDLDADAEDFMSPAAPPPQPRPRQPSVADFDLPPPQQQTGRRSTIQQQNREDFPPPQQPLRRSDPRGDDLGLDRPSPVPVRSRLPSQIDQFDSLPPPQEPSSLHAGALQRKSTIERAAPPENPFHNETMVELRAVMVSRLENARQELRGHSSQVARLLRRVAERMNLDRSETQAMIVAGHIHDLGKMGQFHLTALNCAEYEGHRTAAAKAYDTPLRLLEAVRITSSIKNAVFHMYERFDGKGFPDKLVGKEIPLGARLLSIADTYADLTQNPRNPFRKVLGPAEAVAVLLKHAGTIFDPGLLDLFKSLVLGEDMRAKLMGSRYRVLLVDSDPEESTVLELRMVEQGFDVKTARSVEVARKLLAAESSEFDLVVCEVELPDADGLAFLSEARKEPWGRDMPWVVHTRKQGRTEANRAFELGAMDFVAKPVQADVMVAKLKAMLDQWSTGRGAKGVSGSLREMGLPDIVQVLFHGRKTGRLNVRHAGKNGEIHFLDGAVANALMGDITGKEAFYALLKLTDGDFALDPTFTPPKRIMEESAEALLLEGMRRMDEGL
ncbi:hypothetical protein BH11MYX4_BH11MYX4_57720 [soil metagenome]